MRSQTEYKQKQIEEVQRLKRICFPKARAVSTIKSPSRGASKRIMVRGKLKQEKENECRRERNMSLRSLSISPGRGGLRVIPTKSRLMSRDLDTSAISQNQSVGGLGNLEDITVNYENLRQRAKYGWEHYDRKSKNLERNFQKFTDKYKGNLSFCLDNTSNFLDISRVEDMDQSVISVIDPSECSTSTLHLANISKNISFYDKTLGAKEPIPICEYSTIYLDKLCDTVEQFYSKIFGSLICLAVTHTQEMELRAMLRDYAKGLQKFKALYHRHANKESGDFSQIGKLFSQNLLEIKDRFEYVLVKIQAIASKSFQHYKLKDVCHTFDSLCEEFHKLQFLEFLPRLSLKFVQLKIGHGSLIMENLLKGRKREMNSWAMSNLEGAVRERREWEWEAKRAINQLIWYRGRVEGRELNSALHKWRVCTMGMRECKFGGQEGQLNEYLRQVQGHLGTPSSPFFYAHDILKRSLSASYADIFYQSPGESELYTLIPRTGFLLYKYEMEYELGDYERVSVECRKSEMGLLPLIVNGGETLNIVNVFEDRRFNRKQDMPYVQESYKQCNNMSMLGIPIHASATHSLLGVIRIFTKGMKRKFSAREIQIAYMLGKGMLEALQPFMDFHHNKQRGDATIINLEGIVSNSKTELETMGGMFKLVCEGSMQKSLAEVLENIFGVVNAAIPDENTELYTFDPTCRMFYPTSTEGGCKSPRGVDHSKLLQIMSNQVIVDTTKTEHTNPYTKRLRQTLYLPLFASGGGGTSLGILKIERVSPEITENKVITKPLPLSEHIGGELIRQLQRAVSAGMMKMWSIRENERDRGDLLQSHNLQKFVLSSTILINAVSKLRKRVLSNGFRRIAFTIAFKDKHIPPKALQLQKVCNILKSKLKIYYSNLRHQTYLKYFVRERIVRSLDNLEKYAKSSLRAGFLEFKSACVVRGCETYIHRLVNDTKNLRGLFIFKTFAMRVGAILDRERARAFQRWRQQAIALKTRNLLLLRGFASGIKSAIKTRLTQGMGKLKIYNDQKIRGGKKYQQGLNKLSKMYNRNNSRIAFNQYRSITKSSKQVHAVYYTAMRNIVRIYKQSSEQKRHRYLTKWQRVLSKQVRNMMNKHRNDSVTISNMNREQSVINILYEKISQALAQDFSSMHMFFMSKEIKGALMSIRGYIFDRMPNCDECLITMKASGQGIFYTILNSIITQTPIEGAEESLFTPNYIEKSPQYTRTGTPSKYTPSKRFDLNKSLSEAIKMLEVGPNSGDVNETYITLPEDDIIMNSLEQMQSIVNISDSRSDLNLRTALIARKLKTPRNMVFLPIFSEGSTGEEQKLLGDIELYRNNSMEFTSEEESKLQTLGMNITPCILSIGKCIQAIIQLQEIEEMKSKPQNTFAPVIEEIARCGNLSALLKTFSISLPKIVNCEKVLLILLPEWQMEAKLAYFYSFGDNHIYNFEYENTFVDEICNNGEVVFFPPPGGNKMLKHKSITEEVYGFIKYIPITNTKHRVHAIAEVSWGSHHPVLENIEGMYQIQDTEATMVNLLSREIESFTSTFVARLQTINLLLHKGRQKRINRGFQIWKKYLVLSREGEFMECAQGELGNAEGEVRRMKESMGLYADTVEKYKEELDNLQRGIASQGDANTKLEAEMLQMDIERKAKLKFLAASLLVNHADGYAGRHKSMRTAFHIWRYQLLCNRIAETAFSKVLELNQRHSTARIEAAELLMNKFKEQIEVKLIYSAFKSILHYSVLADETETFGNRPMINKLYS